MIIKTHEVKRLPQTERFQLTDNQQVLLLPIGDTHSESDGFCHEKFRAHIEWGLERGALFIGMGDYLDFAPITQRNLLAPLREGTKKLLDADVRENGNVFLELLEGTRGRWLGMLAGNHTWNFQTGRNIEQYFCEKMNCDYLGTASLIRLKMPAPRGHPEADTVIFAHHGTGNSTVRIGGQLNKLEDLVSWMDADVYLMGHTHAKPTAALDRLMLTPDGVLHHRTRIIARTGSWKRAYLAHKPLDNDEPAVESSGDYEELKALRPTALGGIAIGIGYKKVDGSVYYRPTLHYSV